MTDEQYRRRTRRIEWMQSAHATLRDRYEFRSTAMTVSVMGLSIVGLLFGAANAEQNVRWVGHQAKLQYILAGLAGLIFFISLVQLVTDWPTRRSAHQHAASRLGELSALFQRATVDGGVWSVPNADLATEYDRVMASLVPIPDGKAAGLKARHNRKKELFRRADRHPGSPAWRLRLEILKESLSGGIKTQHAEDCRQDGPPGEKQ